MSNQSSESLEQTYIDCMSDDQWLTVGNAGYEEKTIKLGTLDDQNVVSRKQSASDLQSRLKTRKLLGVGELAGDNGDVYKSKISQLLGINESLYVRLPRGMFCWNTLNTLYFLGIGGVCLVLPTFGAWLEFGIEKLSEEALLFIRLFGIAVMSFGILFKCILQQRESRSDIATLLLINAGFHTMLLIVALLSQGNLPWWSIVTRSVFIIGNICYHSFVDGQGGLHRQLIRIIEDISFMASSPIIEKKPLVEVVDSSSSLSSVETAEEKKTA